MLSTNLIVGLLVVIVVILLFLAWQNQYCSDKHTMQAKTLSGQTRALKADVKAAVKDVADVVSHSVQTVKKTVKDMVSDVKGLPDSESMKENYVSFRCPDYTCPTDLTNKSYSDIICLSPTKIPASLSCVQRKFKETTMPKIKTLLPWKQMKQYGTLAVKTIPGGKDAVCNALGKGTRGVQDLKNWINRNISKLFDKIREKVNFLDKIGIPSSFIDTALSFLKDQIDDPIAKALEKYIMKNMKYWYGEKGFGCPELPPETLDELQQEFTNAVANDPELADAPE